MRDVSCNPVAIVTGVLGGIGSAIADTLGSAGYRVIGLDRRSDYRESRLFEFMQFDIRAVAHDDRSADVLMERIRKASDNVPVALLVNNAADQILGTVAAASADEWRVALETNVVGPARLIAAMHADLTKTQGLVVNISSIHATLSKPGFAPYAVSKAALSALTRAAALDAGSRYRVVGIAPGAVDTHMLREGFDGDPVLLEQLEQVHPFGRIGSPIEVAELVLFLARGTSAFVTGSDIRIDGAISARLHDPA